MARPADPLARPKLLRAARDEFARVGFTEARVEDIARRAGLAKGSLYLRFKSKEELFQALLDHFLVEIACFTDACRPNLDAARTVADVERFLVDHDRQMFEFLWGSRDILGIFLQAGATPQYQPILNAFLDAQAAAAADQIRTLQARGLYRADLDPVLVGASLVGAYHNLTRHLVGQRTKPDLDAAARTLLSFLLEGLAGRELGAVASAEGGGEPRVDPQVTDHPVREHLSSRG